jgi:hypothetical protein
MSNLFDKFGFVHPQFLIDPRYEEEESESKDLFNVERNAAHVLNALIASERHAGSRESINTAAIESRHHSRPQSNRHASSHHSDTTGTHASIMGGLGSDDVASVRETANPHESLQQHQQQPVSSSRGESMESGGLLLSLRRDSKQVRVCIVLCIQQCSA